MQSNGKHICGSKTRNGGTCKNRAMANGRCRMHGGKQKKGSDHHLFRHGIYSKYASESLKEVLDELQDQDSESLMNPENEIKLLQAIIISAKALKGYLSDLKDLEILSKIINQLVLSKQRSQQILLEEKRLIPVTDLERFMEFMEDLLINRVGRKEASIITKQLENFKLSDHAY